MKTIIYGCQYSRIIDHSNLKYHIFKLNFLQIYKQYLDLLFTVIVPLMGLIIFNLRIFLAIRKNRNRWDLDNISSSKTILQLINFSSIRSTRTEITLAKVVLSIVFIFVVCQIPRIYLAFYRVSEKYTTNMIKLHQSSDKYLLKVKQRAIVLYTYFNQCNEPFVLHPIAFLLNILE